MHLIRDLSLLPESQSGGAVAIGNFDGVHLGHARIVERLRAQAAAVRGPAVVFTFDPHPVRLLRPAEAPPPLTWTDRKAELLKELGVDGVVAYPTDEQLLALGPREFFDQIVRGRLRARAMVEGQNFFFGKGRAGNVETLAAYCREAEMTLEIVEPVQAGGAPVSSSRVRGLVAAGDVSGAAALLTRPYRIRGLVTHGAARGAKLGFPTANVSAVDTLLPTPGVYAGAGVIGDERWPAAINLGPNPTFAEAGLKLEVHLIGFAGSLYGQVLEVDFYERLRDVRKFNGVAELVAQLKTDIEAARRAAELRR